MTRHLRQVLFVVFASLLATTPAALAQDATTAASSPTKTPACATNAHTLSCSNGLCELEVSFPLDKTCSIRIDDAFVRTQSSASRITEKTTLKVRVVNVNLLRYAVAFETRETVVESYVYLERLWKQLLGLGDIGRGVAAATAEEREREETFIKAVNDWRTRLDAADADVQAAVGAFPGLVLTNADKKKIDEKATELNGLLKNLAESQQQAKVSITRVEHFALYDETWKGHQAVVDKIDAFDTLSKQIAIGFEKRVPFGAAGRVVAVTITASNKATGKEQPQMIGVEFLVHSTLPVTFHAGYTVRALDELSFETVAGGIQTTGGADLFAKVQDSSVNGTFTALMSYRLCDIARANRCPHLTIGTDFKNVGDRLYGGVSWPIGRAFLTGGLVSGETRQGEGPVNDVLTAAGEVTGSRELFTAISTKRKWGVFLGLSFAPF